MVVELTTFRTVPGVAQETVAAADQRVQTEFSYQQPGLVRRTTARAADGEWLVVTLWDSEADAERATVHAAGHPAVEALAALLDARPEVRRYTDLGG